MAEKKPAGNPQPEKCWRLKAQLEIFQPCNEQEAADRDRILQALDTREGVFERTDETAHITASAWVVNLDRTRVLMVYHNIYHSWSWLGGHADGDADLLAVAMREVREESGLRSLRPVSDEIYSVEVLTVDGHEKRGKYVPSHLHLNVTYLLEADDSQPLFVKEDENSAAAWFELEDALAASAEPWLRDRVYRKLNEKLKQHTSALVSK
ncbi:MAG: NUDIX hydrolase [Lachnospiraceae bacterium]|nr:NUDIX hydrolase [Lachnospiraceae bacterium]